MKSTIETKNAIVKAKKAGVGKLQKANIANMMMDKVKNTWVGFMIS